MEYILIGFGFVIALLVYFMYKVLKGTVDKVNEQTKKYFVDKLQVYDELILEKETKLKEIDEKLENKRAVLSNIKDSSETKNYTFDKSIIDMMADTDYKQDNVSIHKKIDESFDIDYETIINKFLSDNVDNQKYEIAQSIKKKLDSDKIYEISQSIDFLDTILKYLDEEEQKFVCEFMEERNIKKIDDFINYIDDLIAENSPYIEIQVASAKENYNHLSKYINTVVNDEIYKGIRIIYRNKVYDYSLNERNV